MDFAELLCIDAKRLKVFRSRLMTNPQSSRSADCAAELRECTTETIVKTGKHFHLHYGQFLRP